MSDSGRKPGESSHKLGANRHDPAKKPARSAKKEDGGRGKSKDIREDRGIRQHKLGKHKN